MKTRRTALVLAAGLAVTVPAWAQTSSSGSVQSLPSAGSADSGQSTVSDRHPAAEIKELSGTVQMVEGDKVTLTDGTQFIIPSSVLVQENELRPGSEVKASYEERAGEKTAVSIQVEPPR
jgi:hypothetical protein